MILRSLNEERAKIFLTFDDGPDNLSTPLVLDLLKRKNVRATFFLIAEKIPAARALVQRMVREGHALGNHSLDHRFGVYFRGIESMKSWLLASKKTFAREGLHDLVGFRPPAGIVTPPLKIAAEELQLPLVLWNERFYDAVFPWSEARARKSAGKLSGGSIVLLHDRQKPARIKEFLRVLEIYIDSLQARGFELAALPRNGTLTNTLPLYSDFTSQSETVPF